MLCNHLTLSSNIVGPDSQTDSGSEHSVHDKDASDDDIGLGRDKQEVVSDEKLLVCHL